MVICHPRSGCLFSRNYGVNYGVNCGPNRGGTLRENEYLSANPVENSRQQILETRRLWLLLRRLLLRRLLLRLG